MNLNEEVLCGFLVTEEHKHINAVYLEMMKEFGRLCEKHGLTWWLVYGGLIGAVRHKGFIPWDDDIDLMMPRRDFDRLQRMTSEQFGAEEPYFLQNATTQPERETILIRLRRSDTTNIRDTDWENIQKHRGTTENLGLSLAVFPLDNYPKHDWVFRLERGLFQLSFVILKHYHSEKRGPLRFAARCAVGLVGTRNFGVIRQAYRLTGKNRSGKVHSFHTFYPGSNTLFDAEDFRGTVYLPFEDMEVPVPVGYDHLCRETYGDYMQLPPEEARRMPHGGVVRWDMPYREAVRQLLDGEMQYPEESK